MQKIGVLGGTFDPIHLGHLALARCVEQAFELNEVRFMPAYSAKDAGGARVEDRLTMVRLAIQDEPNFALDDLEVATGGRVFTFDLIIRLRAVAANQGGQLYWIMGMDAFQGMSTRWHGGYVALDLCQFVVVSRAGCGLAQASLAALSKVRLFSMLEPAISSALVRRRLRAGRPIDDLVPTAVARYIREHGLYHDHG